MKSYKCDPAKYKECKWRFGYLCGTVCKGTMDPKYAMQDSEGKPIEISDEEDYDEED